MTRSITGRGPEAMGDTEESLAASSTGNRRSKPDLVSLVLRLGTVGGILSLGALFSSLHLVFDLISHFRVQYVVLMLPALGLALSRRRHLVSLVLAACLSVHAHAVYRSLAAGDGSVTGGGPTFTLMSSNLLASNDDHAGHERYVSSVDPDVIVFQEYTPDWDAVLSASLTDYPHRLAVPTGGPVGIAIYSRWPMTEERVFYAAGGHRPSVEAVVSKGTGTLRVIGTHPPPPVSGELFDERNRHLLDVSRTVASRTGPTVVVGDLNTSPWSDHFTSFLEDGNLTDGRRGHGILPTWPTWFGLFQIPIDHIVTAGAVDVVSMGTSPALGSDHKALWAEIEVGGN